MTSTLILPTYRTSPRQPGVQLLGGLENAYSREVPLIVSSVDFGTGFNNVFEMKVWGNLDPAFMPEVYATTEGNARWQPFRPLTSVILAAGVGTRTVSVKLRNASLVETDTLSDSVYLDATTPKADVLWSGFGSSPRMTGKIEFGWSSSHDYTAAEVWATPSLLSERGEGTLLQAYGSGSAGAHNWFSQTMATFLTKDPQPTQAGDKALKIFVQVAGIWY